MRNAMITFLALGLAGLIGCAKPTPVAELAQFPVDDMSGVITRSGVEIDRTVSSDGKGSLRVSADEPTVVRLYEVNGIDVENARLTYQAKVRTADIQGQVFLEMWCQFEGGGEYFSRNVQTPLTGTTDWSTEETPFFLKSGENPDRVKLNLVISGKGTAWIDDIRLVQGPLQ